MAYKCKICGYKFKRGDSDLCPNCFTVRDDIDCTDVKGHDHEKDLPRPPKQDDFIVQQLKDERKMTSGEREEKFKDLTEELKNRAAMNDYSSSQSYTRTTPTRSEPQKFTGYTHSNASYNYNTTETQPNPIAAKHVRIVMIIIFLSFFVLPFIAIIGSVIIGIFIPNSDKKTSNGTNIESNGFKVYADADDVDLYARVDGIMFAEKYDTLIDALSETSTMFNISYEDDELLESKNPWHLIYSDITLNGNDSGGVLIKDVHINGYNEDGSQMYSLRPNEVIDDDDEFYICLPLLICESADRFTIYITTDNEKNIRCDFDFEEIRIVGNDMSSLTDDSVTDYPTPESFDFNYDYNINEYMGSLKDSTQGLELRATGYQISTAFSGGFSDKIQFFDGSLLGDSWTSAEFEILSGENKLDCQIEYIDLIGLDAGFNAAYYYSVSSGDIIPVLYFNDKVKSYHMQVAFTDENGEHYDLQLGFFSDQFFDSAA